MSAITCKVCGWHQRIWIGPQTDECPRYGGTKHCVDTISEAKLEAIKRRVCPDAYDSNGNYIIGNSGRVFEAMIAAGFDPWSGAVLREAT